MRFDGLLAPDERIEATGRLHPAALLPPVVAAAMVTAGAAAIGFVTDPRTTADPVDVAAGIVVAAAWALVASGARRRVATHIAVTDRRILSTAGVAAREVTSIDLRRVAELGLDETALGRIVGFGNVVVGLEGGTSVVLEDLRDPGTVIAAIRRGCTRRRAAAGGSDGAGSDAADPEAARATMLLPRVVV